MHPVVLYGASLGDALQANDMPVARLTVVRGWAGLGVTVCKLFDIEILPLVIELDERILLEMLRFARCCAAAPRTAATAVAEDVVFDVEAIYNGPVDTVVMSRDSTQATYFEVCF